MNKMILFLLCMANALIASAQYCCLQEGQKLRYEMFDGEKSSEIISSVVNVEERNDSCFVTVRDSVPEMNERLKGATLCSRMACSGGNTLVYLQDENTGRENIYSMLSGALDEKQLAEAKDKFSMEGEISLLLNDGMKEGDKLAPCEMTIHIGPLSMKTTMKGKCEGREILSVPAGRFECVKVAYTLKLKFFLFSETSEVTEWYAKGVGLVKHEETSKKTGKTMVKTLNLFPASR